MFALDKEDSAMIKYTLTSRDGDLLATHNGGFVTKNEEHTSDRVAATGDSSTRLVVNPFLTISRAGDDELFVQRGSRAKLSRVISDPDGLRKLADVVGFFSTPRPATEISELADDTETRETLSGFVDQLHASDVLVEEAHLDMAFFLSGDGSPPSTLDRDTTYVVGIAGDGVIADAARRQLQDIGFLAVQHIEPARTSDESARVDELETLFEESDLVVIASDDRDLGRLLNINQVALASNTPWLAAYLDGFEINVGPLFVPFQSACYAEFAQQTDASRVHTQPPPIGPPALVEAPDVPRTVPSFVADLAASMISLACTQRAITSISYLEPAYIRIDLERLEIVRERVLRLPRCRQCARFGEDRRHPFL